MGRIIQEGKPKIIIIIIIIIMIMIIIMINKYSKTDITYT